MSEIGPMEETMDQFYCELLYALGEHARRGGTGTGAAAVAKRVALAFGVDLAERLPLPRLTRYEFDHFRWQRQNA